MKQIELENLSKDELFEKIKAEYASKAKRYLVTGIVFGLFCLANMYFSVDYSFSSVLMCVILFVVTLGAVLFFLMAKNIMKAENAEDLLSRYDAIPYIVVPFIAVPALFLIGYLIYHMITDINIERFGVVLFWLIITFYVLCFILLCFLSLWMMCIPMKGKAKGIGWKDDSIECLRELVANEQQDTL